MSPHFSSTFPWNFPLLLARGVLPSFGTSALDQPSFSWPVQDILETYSKHHYLVLFYFVCVCVLKVIELELVTLLAIHSQQIFQQLWTFVDMWNENSLSFKNKYRLVTGRVFDPLKKWFDNMYSANMNAHANMKKIHVKKNSKINEWMCVCTSMVLYFVSVFWFQPSSLCPTASAFHYDSELTKFG